MPFNGHKRADNRLTPPPPPLFVEKIINLVKQISKNLNRCLLTVTNVQIISQPLPLPHFLWKKNYKFSKTDRKKRKVLSREFLRKAGGSPPKTLMPNRIGLMNQTQPLSSVEEAGAAPALKKWFCGLWIKEIIFLHSDCPRFESLPRVELFILPYPQ